MQFTRKGRRATSMFEETTESVPFNPKANRDRYLEDNGHNMVGIGELGSSSDESNCSGFHNCQFGAKSLPTKCDRLGCHHRWSNRLGRSASEKVLPVEMPQHQETIHSRSNRIDFSQSLPQIMMQNPSHVHLEKSRMGAYIFSTDNFKRIC